MRVRPWTLDGVVHLPSPLIGERRTHEDLGIAAFLILYGVEATIHAAVVERPEYVKDGRLTDELTVLVLGYLSSEASG